MRERRGRDRLLIACAVCGVLALAICVPVSIGVLKNTGRITSQERGDRDALREAAFRLCSRDMDNRAELHAAARERGDLVMFRRRERRLPILDCSPNLDGGAARRVPRPIAHRFVRLFAANRVPLFCDGKTLTGTHAHRPACRGISPVH